MMLTLRACGSALHEIGSRFLLFLGANIAAMLLSLPLIVVALVLAMLFRSLSSFPLLLVVLIGVPPNPAAMGLHTLAREAARRNGPEPVDQWQGLKANWLPALKAWLVSVAVTAFGGLNVLFYASQATSPSSGLHGIGAPLAVLWTVLLIFWIGMHMYVAPLLLAQERDDLVLLYRNAATLVLSRPLTTWTLVPLWIAVLLLASVSGLITLIGLALAAAIQQNVLRLLLPTFLPAPEQYPESTGGRQT